MKNFDYLTKEETERLINSISNIKHKLITLIMLDTGMRVSECTSLKFKNIDFKNRTITIKSLKKKDTKKVFRTIPLSNRLYQCFGDYLNKHNKLKLDANAYVFPTYSETGHIGRKSVWRVLNRYAQLLNIPHLHPHALRHSFATFHLSNGSTLEEIKEMLGHQKFDTTLIYASIPVEKLKERVNNVTQKKPSFFARIFKRKKRTKLINLDFAQSYFTVGRNQQLKILENNANKGINTVVIGNIGVGKSHLLDNFKTSKKILRLDDSESIKKSLAQILLFLYQDKKTVLNKIWENFTIDEIKKKIQRENTINLCDTISASVEPNEYVLIIDDISKITPTGKKMIERLKDTFVIICGSRGVKANDTSFIWNFEVMKIKELNRNFSMQLIQQLSAGMQVENWELFRNHIYEQSNGNPRAITELINRYKKEPFITNEVVREIKHIGALPEFDMTFLVLLFLGIITAMRYMSRELDEPALRFIGSIGLILLIVSRPLLRSLKKQFI